MKKLLTIICALSLIMAFSMPASATDPIVDDTQLGINLGSAQANDDSIAVDANDNEYNEAGDSVVTRGGEMEEYDNTGDVVTKGGELDNSVDNEREDYVEDNSGMLATKGGENEIDNSVDNEREDYAENNGDAAWKGGEIDNSTETAEGDNVATKGGEITTVEMEDNQAAAAMGGTALAIEIEDIELNLAATTSYSGIIQESEFNAGSLFSLSGDDGVDAFNDNCFKVEASVYSNTGITGANFTSGNFNNSANLNNVTMTVQY